MQKQKDGFRFWALWTVMIVVVTWNSAIFAAKKPVVVTTIQPLALIVKDIAGDLVEIQVLVDRAASPHDFALTIGQALTLADADLLVWVGPSFEGFIEGVKIPERSVRMLTGHAGAVHHDHHYKSGVHPWLGTTSVEQLGSVLAQELGELLPHHLDTIAQRHKQFNETLALRRASVSRLLIPHRETPFIVFHDAYDAFVEEHQLNQIASLTLVPHESISAKRLNDVSGSAKSASCLLADRAETHLVKRYASLLGVRAEFIDFLAAEPGVSSFDQYHEALGEVFVRCLSKEPLATSQRLSR